MDTPDPAAPPPPDTAPLPPAIVEYPASLHPVGQFETQAPGNSRDDKLKAHIRAILAAQPFRGNAVHKDDLIAVIDALIDGPDRPEEEPAPPAEAAA